MSYAITDEQEYPRITPAVRWLLALNVAIYFLQLTAPFGKDIDGWLAFERADLPYAWWRGLTYMFVHGGFWHLAGNMYMLWLFGPRIEHQWGPPGKFARFYLLCGAGGALTYLLTMRQGTLVGASGAVYGVMVAYAVSYPETEFSLFGIVPIKVKWLVLGYVAYDLFMGLSGVSGATPTAYWAHVGGALTAMLYLRTPSAQGIERLRERISQVPDVPDETPRAVPRSLPRPRERGSDIDEILAKSKAAAVTKRPAAPPPPAPTLQGSKRAEELNLVLDKISEQGLGSLTSDERRLLEEMSRRLRNG
jgi:membrane associated rhomboid family serine protease